MTPELFSRVRRVFLQASQADPRDLGTLLDQACHGEPALRSEVERLLQEDRAARTDSGLNGAAKLLDRHTERLPSWIGQYRILGLLGVGGMGVVYDAEQRSPARRVALKVVRHAPWLQDLAWRFAQREAAALARLTHPAVASIYEAGTDKGWQYFAMERIEGAPLTIYARTKELNLAERLTLFAAVIDGVHYAHQRGVIHRDLKPSNILVTDSGQPKILDFGLARIIDHDAEHTAHVTASGGLMGTLAYMSPEQAQGESSDVDTRSDIYSLGVVLYELLTDRLPYSVAGVNLQDGLRMISEFTPPSPGTLIRSLRGDVSTVVLKALRKDCNQRYDTAAAFGEDIRRFLANEPILARPASSVYVLNRLIRRHAGLSLGLAAALIAIVVGATVATREAIRANGETQRVQHEIDRADQLIAYLEERLRSEFTTGRGLDSGSSRYAIACADHGANLLTFGRFEEAEQWLLKSYRVLRFAFGTWDNNNQCGWHFSLVDSGVNRIEEILNGVTFVPSRPQRDSYFKIYYDPTDRPLANEETIFVHVGYNHWKVTKQRDVLMKPLADGRFRARLHMPRDAWQIDLCFHSAGGSQRAAVWDSDDGRDWHLLTHDFSENGDSHGGRVRVTLDTPDEPAHLLVAYDPSAGPLASATRVVVHVGFDLDWTPTDSSVIPMQWNDEQSRWLATIPAKPDAEQVDFCFSDGDRLDHGIVQKNISELIDLYERWGRPTQASQFRQLKIEAGRASK